ncbi:uncharacterized protein EHS24_007163 [Apiotrichum porosum]|uniref:Uncharacterized protein n=1 Tax=Apiotrichum porosum TaxID=105984 RepID=A0A427XX70_9TREE|nr:uncharacterized protein EHS24_007163 [Apiotrichum porosum]RSH83478.1 hypothetical protein EHS24_007163 [Apiotrichum porosum]
MTWEDAVRHARVPRCGGTFYGDNKKSPCKPIARNDGVVVCWWCNRWLGTFELRTRSASTSSTSSASAQYVSGSELSVGSSASPVSSPRPDHHHRKSVTVSLAGLLDAAAPPSPPR